ncbi:nuclear transport factor 2 family protein [Pseudomaricurvus alkylphenolicus]|jgi:hypothetical protein|uniref:nuclear transport factor 2 family protein n=1 Tax=Pseudomaricurvus alkylphenolicus TaxID=1306991 RepID=UPI00141FFDD0|nr:nuclear transport factor 2 family protein [Pseudomaricurvus alkylphenolicus]NIB37978.1 nuclear transport factor 2 family protein [Pseudomaricurvus alkylphenolicus]
MDSLADIESIKQLKSRYFRFLDNKQWDQWRLCFSDDFSAVYEGPHPDIEFKSAEELVEKLRTALAEVPTVHQGHTSEITVTSGDTATGIWSMYDRVVSPQSSFEGWGFYHEQYRKVDGEWKISHLRLKRLLISPLAGE